MSWKLATLAIALFGLLASGLVAGQQLVRQSTCPHDPSPACLAEHANSPSAAVPSDEELIKKQKTCPVTDQPLGSMGKPVKVVVKGRTVFLCCAGCTKKLLADPDKYLKKLDGQK